MLAGVAASIARYTGIDVSIVRVALAVFALAGLLGMPWFLAGLPLYLAGIPLYLAGWLLIPEEGRDQSIARHLLQSLQARSR